MNATMHLRKEARQMMWPAVILFFIAFFSLFRDFAAGSIFRSELDYFLILGVFVGVQALAALVFGFEYEYNTHLLTLTLPVDRLAVWRNKQMTVLAAILPSAAVFLYSAHLYTSHEKDFLLFASWWMLVSAAGAAFWTIAARSTIQGVTINTAFSMGLVALFNYADWKLAESSAHRPVLIALGVLNVAYSVGMVWLGREFYARHQVAGQIASDEMLDWNQRYLPTPLLSALRARPDSPYLNLVRRELHLLKPALLLVAIDITSWILISLFHLWPHGKDEVPVAIATAAMLTPVIAMVAGTLSLGEDRARGTHDQHLTLPVSVNAQWAIKLGVALAVSLFGAALLPMTGAYFMARIAHLKMFGADGYLIWSASALAMTMIAFWSASIVKGTVRATLITLPICFCFALASEFGMMTGFGAMNVISAPVARVFLAVDPFYIVSRIKEFETTHLIQSVGIPVTIAMLFSSRFYFRKRNEDSLANLVRAVSPVVLLAFSLFFFLFSLIGLWQIAYQQQMTLFRETHEAIKAMQVSGPIQGAVSYPAQELELHAKTSEFTRVWLGDATIQVTPLQHLQLERGCCRNYYAMTPNVAPKIAPYMATLTLRNGMTCHIYYRTWAPDFGLVAGGCIRPGEKAE